MLPLRIRQAAENFSFFIRNFNLGLIFYMYCRFAITICYKVRSYFGL